MEYGIYLKGDNHMEFVVKCVQSYEDERGKAFTEGSIYNVIENNESNLIIIDNFNENLHTDEVFLASYFDFTDYTPKSVWVFLKDNK